MGKCYNQIEQDFHTFKLIKLFLRSIYTFFHTSPLGSTLIPPSPKMANTTLNFDCSIILSTILDNNAQNAQ